MDKITTEIAELFYVEEDIFCTRLKEGAEIDIFRAKENFVASQQITQGKRYAAFSDARGFMSITKEAMAFGSAKECNDPIIAHAILVNSLPNRLMGNFIIKFHRPPAPTRLFTDEQEALTWLREKLKEYKKAQKK
jgi:hypothetical protein